MSRRRREGFTLIEIMAVLAIVGVILLAVVPSLDGQVPAYRLRSGARKVASQIELCQTVTIADRKKYVLAYDLDRNTYQILLPPEAEEESAEEGAEGEEGLGELAQGAGARSSNDMEHGTPPPNPNAVEGEEEEEEEEDESDFSGRDGLGIQQLPDDIVFAMVVVGEKEHRSGRVFVPFSHLGNEGAHIVGVTIGSERNSGQAEQVWVKFSPLTRTIMFTEQRPELRTLEAESE